MKAQNINRLKIFTYSALFIAMCIGWAGCETFESIQELYAAGSLDTDNDFDYDYSRERSFAPEPRIVGGRESVPHSHPYIVAIDVHNGTHWKFCGGSILTREWVLTAAHCFDRKNNSIFIRAGKHNISYFHSTGELRDGIKLVVHRLYNKYTWEHDIAVVKVDRPFVYKQSVKPAKLVKSGTNIKGRATVAGWGRLGENASTSNVLMEVEVMIIPNSLCRERYPDDVIYNTTVCAGWKKGKKAACNGESGGPLFQKLNGTETVVGIVSWGEGCGRPMKPDVYTRVGKYMEFIKDKTGYGAKRGSVSKVHGRFLSPWRPWNNNKMQNLQPRNPAPRNPGTWNPGWWNFRL